MSALGDEVSAVRRGPPPLSPFGLVLHHDGRFSHEGQPILNRKLREHFDRSVSFLAEEEKYIVRLGHFRGEVEVEEAGFFVREVNWETGAVMLSDGTQEPLVPATLSESAIDGALICRVKRSLSPPDGLPARFMHAAQSELLQAVEVEGDRIVLPLAGRRLELPLALE